MPSINSHFTHIECENGRTFLTPVWDRVSRSACSHANEGRKRERRTHSQARLRFRLQTASLQRGRSSDHSSSLCNGRVGNTFIRTSPCPHAVWVNKTAWMPLSCARGVVGGSVGGVMSLPCLCHCCRLTCHLSWVLHGVSVCLSVLW